MTGDALRIRPNLFFHDVTKSVPPKGRARAPRKIEGFSMLVAPGERVGLLGTPKDCVDLLLRLAMGMDQPESGRVYVDRPVAVMANTGFLLDDTLEYNIIRNAMAMNLSGSTLRSIVELIATETLAGDHLGTLVGDCDPLLVEQVRLCLGLATAPNVLLVGEPELGGRALTDEKGKERLDAHSQRGGSLVIASHSSRLLARTCARTVWVRSGEILMDGAPSVVGRRQRQLLQADKEGDKALVRQLVRRFRRQYLAPDFQVQGSGRRRG